MEINYSEGQESTRDGRDSSSYGDLLQEILHPFHPCHCLTLQKHGVHTMLYLDMFCYCDLCCFNIYQGFSYRCDECNFNLHLECASLKPNVRYEGHKHLLNVVENLSYESVCQACDSEIEGIFFVRCVECSLDFHMGCHPDFPIQLTVVHKSHQHPLTFSNKQIFDSDKFSCSVCKKERNPDNPFYSCAECDYFAHVTCAVTEIQEQSDCLEKLKHFSHLHMLILCEDEVYDSSYCYACERTIEAPVYICSRCPFYLHKSCAELPREIHHPFHRHPLTLQKCRDFKCNSCGKFCKGFSYTCPECNFNLDVDCASLRPSIKFEGHKHMLTFFQKLYDHPYCQMCWRICSLRSSSLDVPYLRCVMCNFNIHLYCSMLPGTIKHRSHSHALTLMIGFDKCDFTMYHCDICRTKEDTRELVYYCSECFYVIHFNCVIPEVVLALSQAGEKGTNKEEREIRNVENEHSFLHEHPITVCERDDKDNKVPCQGCGDPLPDESYSCEVCHFYPSECICCNESPSGNFYFCKFCWPKSPFFHKDCVKLLQGIEISNHPHSPLRIEESSSSLACDFCYTTNGENKFCCEKCDFQICVKCSSVVLDYHEGRQHIKHLSHRHPLTLLDVDDKNCMVCFNTIDGSPSYGCAPCGFYIHKSCYELPREIRHPFHPGHYLTLQNLREGVYCCDACGNCFDGLFIVYKCDECDFNLHPGCVPLKPYIKYNCHKHLLNLFENMPASSNCQICGLEIIRGSFFVRCVQCRLNFHVQCGPHPLPLSVVLKHHHQHSLTLTETKVKDNSFLFYCDVCRREENQKYPFYYCDECQCSVHVRCAITEMKFDEKGKLKHFTHQHILNLCENEINNEDFCYACENRIQGPRYSCHTCKLHLHKSCAELPREIKHPFHKHPLALPEPYSAVINECNACHKYCYGFTYSCGNCNFHLDIDCISLQPSIKYVGHLRHKLTLFKKLYDVPECIAGCDFTSPNAFYLRCVICNINIHLKCSPLPQTVKHQSHQHFLTLADSVVEDDLYDYYVCDVCEERRDPQECVYYCEECCFVAEFDCVISQVIQCLEKEPREFQLRTVKRKIPDKLIIKSSTLQDLLESFTEEEVKTMADIFEETEKEWQEISETLSEVVDDESGDEDKFSIPEKYPYSDEVLSQFMGRLYRKQRRIYLEDVYDVKDEIVHIGDHTITRSLAPVLRKLLDKHPDMDADCALTQRQKTAFLVMFSWVVQSMSETKVVNITNHLILTWCFCMRVVLRAGFRIHFAYDHLKTITHARYGIENQILRYRNLYELYEEMDETSYHIDKLMGEIEELRKQKLQIISTRRSERSRTEANRFCEALELRMKNAATGLL